MKSEREALSFFIASSSEENTPLLLHQRTPLLVSQMEVPKDQIATLMEHGLYDSAEMLGSFLVSSSTVSTETSPHLKAENLIILGDALFHQREYRRAIHTYKQALQHCTRIPKQSSGISRSSLSLSTRSSVNASGNSAINENEVRFKIASSHFALNETKAAIAEMESVKTRNLEMNVLMAKLHRNSGYNRGAIAFYKECLRQCPYVLEAVIGLAELGVAAKDIISYFTQTSSRSAKVSLDQIDPTRWLQVSVFSTYDDEICLQVNILNMRTS